MPVPGLCVFVCVCVCVCVCVSSGFKIDFHGSNPRQDHVTWRNKTQLNTELRTLKHSRPIFHMSPVVFICTHTSLYDTVCQGCVFLCVSVLVRVHHGVFQICTCTHWPRRIHTHISNPFKRTPAARRILIHTQDTVQLRNKHDPVKQIRTLVGAEHFCCQSLLERQHQCPVHWQVLPKNYCVTRSQLHANQVLLHANQAWKTSTIYYDI